MFSKDLIFSRVNWWLPLTLLIKEFSNHIWQERTDFSFILEFRMYASSWEIILQLEIHRTKIRNWDWDRILTRKCIYGNRYFRLQFWNFYLKNMRVFLLFLIATWLNSQNLYMNLSLRLNFKRKFEYGKPV